MQVTYGAMAAGEDVLAEANDPRLNGPDNAFPELGPVAVGVSPLKHLTVSRITPLVSIDWFPLIGFQWLVSIGYSIGYYIGYSIGFHWFPGSSTNKNRCDERERGILSQTYFGWIRVSLSSYATGPEPSCLCELSAIIAPNNPQDLNYLNSQCVKQSVKFTDLNRYVD